MIDKESQGLVFDVGHAAPASGHSSNTRVATSFDTSSEDQQSPVLMFDTSPAGSSA